MKRLTYGIQRKLQLLIAIIITCFISSCKQTDPVYLQSIKEWHQLRIDSLKGETGFLNLAGLYWFEDSLATFGSDRSNTFVFPQKSPSRLGIFLVKDSSVYLAPEDSIEIGGKIAEDTMLVFNDTIDITMSYKNLHWFIITRGTHVGVRLRDFGNPLLTSFDSIDYFPTDPDWKLIAKWESYKEPKSVAFNNMVGMTINYPIYGAFSFSKDGKEYKLEPLGEPEPDGYFIMFYDKTSGHSTYGSGRYIYVKEPDENGESIIDFNKAYNPPCAFTSYATCLFPHKENRLPIFVKAGEKFSGH